MSRKKRPKAKSPQQQAASAEPAKPVPGASGGGGGGGAGLETGPRGKFPKFREVYYLKDPRRDEPPTDY